MTENNEEKPKRVRRTKAEIEADKATDLSYKFNSSEYYEMRQKQDGRGYIQDVEALKDQFVGDEPSKHIFRCKLRAAKAYDVSIKHLERAYYELNGKKIDGFYINQLLDRFGFHDGLQVSRKTYLEQLKSNSGRHAVDVAEQKLKEILNNPNIRDSYSSYIIEGMDQDNRETKDKSVYGEQ